jgi:NAD-dependent dihydropyrimidine dehydrogenase PreA subunit/flavodoxin
MIFCFSGTGNTRWAAERLADATGERLCFIPNELQTDCTYTLASDERLGFCFPIHGWQPPKIVRQFIEKLTFNGSATQRPYVYALCTCGDSAGLAVEMLRRQLADKGLHLSSCQSLVMPESYVCLPFMYTDTPQREHEKISRSEVLLEQYTKRVVTREADFEDVRRGATPWLFSHVIGAYFNARMITDSKFTVDADVCTHCGRCARECPVGNIELKEKLPSWKHDGSCTCCLSCYHHCPVHAINYGKITRRRGQYYFGHK